LLDMASSDDIRLSWRGKIRLSFRHYDSVAILLRYHEESWMFSNRLSF
jgi:hypothetical protein